MVKMANLTLRIFYHNLKQFSCFVIFLKEGEAGWKGILRPGLYVQVGGKGPCRQRE